MIRLLKIFAKKNSIDRIRLIECFLKKVPTAFTHCGDFFLTLILEDFRTEKVLNMLLITVIKFQVIHSVFKIDSVKILFRK